MKFHYSRNIAIILASTLLLKKTKILFAALLKINIMFNWLEQTNVV